MPQPVAHKAGDSRRQRQQHRLQRAVGDLGHLLVGTVLDRMLDEHCCRIGAERGCLMRRGLGELHGRDERSRDTATFQVNDVVHTARRAAPSIGERFEHRVAT